MSNIIELTPEILEKRLAIDHPGWASTLPAGQPQDYPWPEYGPNLRSEEPPPAPRFIIQGFLPEDVFATSGTGGVAKSTIRLFIAIHIALGRPLWGMEIARPGPVVYITAEDPQEKVRWRLWYMAQQLELTHSEREHLDHEIKIVDLTGASRRLVEFDRQGNLIIAPLADRVIQEYQSVAPSVIEFDTLQKFVAGLDSHVNEAADQAVNAAMRIRKGLACATGFIGHVSKEVRRSGTVDHHALRGGSALGDGCRAVYQVVPIQQDNLKKIDGWESLSREDLEQGQLSAFYVTKMNDAPLRRHPLVLRRRHWIFELIDLEHDQAEADLARQAERRAQQRANVDVMVAAIGERSYQKLSRRQAEAMHSQLGLSRAELRDAIELGILDGFLVEADLPPSECKGAKKTYLQIASSRPAQ